MNASLRKIALVSALIMFNPIGFAQQLPQPGATGTAAAAGATLERVQRDIIASWIVDVTGEKRTRTLNIRGAEGGADGIWTLAATYGWTDGGQSAVKAELRLVSEVYRLEFITQPGSLVIAEGVGNGTLTGTFTPKGGSARPVKLSRTSDDELRQRVASLETLRAAHKADALKWLERDKFQIYLPKYGFLYQTYPKDGYTYMTGWRDPCALDIGEKSPRRIPTKFLIDDDGNLNLEFEFGQGCVEFKYVFTGTEGSSYTRDVNGRWVRRSLVVELRD